MKLIAAILGLFYILISANVIRIRTKQKKAIGEDNIELKKAVRAHSNFIEYTPIFLILAFLAGENQVTYILSICFILGRILHFLSMAYLEKYDGKKLITSPKYRVIGMLLTFTSIALISIYLILSII